MLDISLFCFTFFVKRLAQYWYMWITVLMQKKEGFKYFQDNASGVFKFRTPRSILGKKKLLRINKHLKFHKVSTEKKNPQSFFFFIKFILLITHVQHYTRMRFVSNTQA